MADNGPIARNAPCPCGSGRRYKDCHGSLAGSASDPLVRARACLRTGDAAGLENACAEVLAGVPDHPVALQLLAQHDYDLGRPQDALRKMLQGIRALSGHAIDRQGAYEIWSTLNFMFAQALAGLGVAKATFQRDAYYRRLDRATVPRSQVKGAVSVVVVVPASAPAKALASTLDAVAAQSLPPAEVVVVHRAAVAPLHPDDMRSRCGTVPVRLHACAGDPLAGSINAGVSIASGRWIAVLVAPDSWERTHLESLIESLEASDSTWGFSGCGCEQGEDVDDARFSAHVASLRSLQESIEEADTVGFALISQAFPAVGEGAVVFARELWQTLGGFRPLPGHEVWDFAMRALWLAEPWYSARPTFRRQVTAAELDADANAREATQVALFCDYYRLACDPAAVPPNEFAPSLARWGLHSLKRVFQTGHLLTFDVPTIERLGDLVLGAVEATHKAPLTPGINFVGFAFGEFGLGESLRALARAAEAGSIPFTVKDVDQRLRARQADRSLAAHIGDDLRHTLSLMCLNPDMLKPVLPILQESRNRGGRSVGYWYWELESVPRPWDDAFAAVDEIWCATEFIARAMRGATTKPVVKITPPIELALERQYRRSDFGLPAEPFLFLFTFDFNSFLERKNPAAAIRAFRSAFPRGRGDVGLVVKSINGAHRPELVATIRAVIGDDPRIIQLDGFFSRDQTFGLTSVVDAYVSLHRAEGLGLGLAEAMYLGKPVIGTGYSGNLEFMNEGNSALVDYRLVPIAAGEYLYDDSRFVWADPDVDVAARLMRRLVDDRDWRFALAGAGQHEIRSRFTRERAAAGIASRLAELGIVVPATSAAGEPDVFVSYAQNGEDVLLYKALSDIAPGFYIDIGANDPDTHSVTRAFYDRGWRGINVEPVPTLHQRLAAARPRDVNLAVAVGRTCGSTTFYDFPGTGLSCVDPALAARHRRAGHPVVEREVPSLTLDAIWREHVRGDVHFLKVDVEGAEAAVIAGARLDEHRPWIVVVEATAPLTGASSFATWEPLLQEAGYRYALDDGLNRYYVSQEHAELAARLTATAAFATKHVAEIVATAADLGDEQRFDPAAVQFLDIRDGEPTLAQPVSQLCTEGQFREAVYARWCREIRELPVLHRKQWEFVYVLQVLEQSGLLIPGLRGLGFGCGREPLAAYFATRGCTIVATDLDAAAAHGHGWVETDQHATRLEDLNDRKICPDDLFAERVSFRPADMNAIPADATGFDFVWSCCAFEHLGSIEHGLRFVRAAMRCLRPGGIAVHTTEFNLSSNLRTIESPDLSVFRRQDIERLAASLTATGHRVAPLNLHPGAGPIDRYVDLPPYRNEPHLKLRLNQFVLTSIGLTVHKAE